MKDINISFVMSIFAQNHIFNSFWRLLLKGENIYTVETKVAFHFISGLCWSTLDSSLIAKKIFWKKLFSKVFILPGKKKKKKKKTNSFIIQQRLTVELGYYSCDYNDIQNFTWWIFTSDIFYRILLMCKLGQVSCISNTQDRNV